MSNDGVKKSIRLTRFQRLSLNALAYSFVLSRGTSKRKSIKFQKEILNKEDSHSTVESKLFYFKLEFAS